MKRLALFVVWPFIATFFLLTFAGFLVIAWPLILTELVKLDD